MSKNSQEMATMGKSGAYFSENEFQTPPQISQDWFETPPPKKKFMRCIHQLRSHLRRLLLIGWFARWVHHAFEKFLFKETQPTENTNTKIKNFVFVFSVGCVKVWSKLRRHNSRYSSTSTPADVLKYFSLFADGGQVEGFEYTPFFKNILYLVKKITFIFEKSLPCKNFHFVEKSDTCNIFHFSLSTSKKKKSPTLCPFPPNWAACKLNESEQALRIFFFSKKYFYKIFF